MLKVNEIFGPTIQGEGHSAGKKVSFLRLSGCNLHCVWCDTPYTWNWTGTKFAHPEKYDQASETHEMTDSQVFVKLTALSHTVRRLVISGGEPLIQQKQLIPLLAKLKVSSWTIEVETNGTILPHPQFVSWIDQFNCSPKLSNSGDPQKLRERPQALRQFAAMTNCYFKFVIATREDVMEVLSLVKKYQIRPSNIYLMPEGRTREQLDTHRDATKALCEAYNFHFTDRLHIVEFGAKRAV